MTNPHDDIYRMTVEGDKPLEKQKRRGAVLVYEMLREDILWLKIAPGTAIDEVALAERFSVSRTPIREALLLLQGEWLVQFLANRTSFVAPLTLNNTGQYFDTHLMLARMAARSAALSGRADKDRLMTHVSAFRDALDTGDHRAALRASLAMTRDLTGLSRNIFLERYLSHSLDSGIRAKIMHYFPNATQEELVKAAEMHEALIDAVASGDAEDSDTATRVLIMHEIEIIMRSQQPSYGAVMDIANLEGAS